MMLDQLLDLALSLFGGGLVFDLAVLRFAAPMIANQRPEICGRQARRADSGGPLRDVVRRRARAADCNPGD
jgi:hypothetical protein